MDTSVFGALFDFEDPGRVEVTRELLRRISVGRLEGYISVLLLDEVAQAPAGLRAGLEEAVRKAGPKVLEETPDALSLSAAYLEAGLLSPSFPGRCPAYRLRLGARHGCGGIVEFSAHGQPGAEAAGAFRECASGISFAGHRFAVGGGLCLSVGSIAPWSGFTRRGRGTRPGLKSKGPRSSPARPRGVPSNGWACAGPRRRRVPPPPGDRKGFVSSVFGNPEGRITLRPFGFSSF